MAIPTTMSSLDAVFKAPNGADLRVPAFWAGDQTWKVRFAGAEEGEYAFETVCSDSADTGLHGQSGTITVEPYTGDNPLLQHGRLRVADDKRHFEHQDGTPFFWTGDTWWMGPYDALRLAPRVSDARRGPCRQGF